MANDTTKPTREVTGTKDSMGNGMPALTPVEDDYNAKIANGTGHTSTQMGNGAKRADGFYKEPDAAAVAGGSGNKGADRKDSLVGGSKPGGDTPKGR
ncbi:MAG: hypothetical protein EON60_00015 [Alphaproteobacteria bacterium]|nr:MAG: hypothetical protein EON60_00015 [Alphaproteobacteria bacterium]